MNYVLALPVSQKLLLKTFFFAFMKELFEVLIYKMFPLPLFQRRYNIDDVSNI